jgi:hypothetical protein
MLARDKHSSLLQTSINYGLKKFYNIGPWSQTWETTGSLLTLSKKLERLSPTTPKIFQENEAKFK